MIWRILAGLFLVIAVVQTVRVSQADDGHAKRADSCDEQMATRTGEVLYLCASANLNDPRVAKICR